MTKDKKETFADKLRRFEYKADLRTVFDDFLTITICSFGQIPGEGKSYDEALYLEIINKYKENNLYREFPKLLACLINEMTDRQKGDSGWDVLGEFYETHLSRKGLSQFFTPWPISAFMAQCSVDEVKKANESLERPLRILDPSCGSGRTLMCASRIAGPNEEYFAIDVDHTCVKMTILNLFLSGIFNAEVMCGDALATADFRGSYKASLVPFGIFRIEDKNESYLWHLQQNTFAASKKSIQAPPELNPNKYPKGSQMKFF